MGFDDAVVACLIAVAVWILLSGLDDLFISLVWSLPAEAFAWPADSDLAEARERRTALFVPLWGEQAVIQQMLEHNLTAIEYRNFDVFVGVYPNDQATSRAVAEVERRHGRVHRAMVGHDGPTSKADCLNAIYAHMRAFEARFGVRFETIITHDAEDLIHGESLRLINWYLGEYQMVQVPVLALPTGMGEFTHGLYCDEFAEYQSKDIPVRQRLGGFLPSNGVGTGFDRAALERVALMRGGRMFDPACLTEDYEMGYRLHLLGCRQIFLPVRFRGGEPVATREYFPRRFRAAVRQRSRWVTGIVLQGWQNHGWGSDAREAYWFWRDRKGLMGNLLAPLVNLLFLYGIADSGLRHMVPGWLRALYPVTAAIAVVQVSYRMAASARVYGWRFASLVPLRMLWGNVVNCAATLLAVRQFALSRLRKEALHWRKTEHVYPVDGGRPRLGELLVAMRILPVSELEAALRNKPETVRLGEYLRREGKISEWNLHRALSAQRGAEVGRAPQAVP